jgi:hypothetical protein
MRGEEKAARPGRGEDGAGFSAAGRSCHAADTRRLIDLLGDIRECPEDRLERFVNVACRQHKALRQAAKRAQDELAELAPMALVPGEHVGPVTFVPPDQIAVVLASSRRSAAIGLQIPDRRLLEGIYHELAAVLPHHPDRAAVAAAVLAAALCGNDEPSEGGWYTLALTAVARFAPAGERQLEALRRVLRQGVTPALVVLAAPRTAQILLLPLGRNAASLRPAEAWV